MSARPTWWRADGRALSSACTTPGRSQISEARFARAAAGRHEAKTCTTSSKNVIGKGCGDEFPYIPGKRYLDWDLPGPQDRSPEAVRETRDEIARRLEELLNSL